jgi:dipeptidase
MKTEKWYQRRLAKYFTEHYEQYEDTATYWPDPFINQWLFDIPERGVRVELTCTDKGEVKEQRYKMQKFAENVCKKLQSEAQGMDAIYEDYILSVIGEEGFELLREKRYLNTCGSINGRNLYTLL